MWRSQVHVFYNNDFSSIVENSYVGGDENVSRDKWKKVIPIPTESESCSILSDKDCRICSRLDQFKVEVNNLTKDSPCCIKVCQNTLFLLL